MNRAIRGRNIDTVFVLIVFSIFALSVLMVLMLGASVYRNINDISLDGQVEQTTLSYIWTRTKNFDDADSLRVGEFGGVSALFIDEMIGDTEYTTAIYGHDGWLLELFSEVGLNLSPQDGIQVTRIGSLHFEEAGHGLIRVTADNKILYLSPRGGYDVPIYGTPGGTE